MPTMSNLYTPQPSTRARNSGSVGFLSKPTRLQFLRTSIWRRHSGCRFRRLELLNSLVQPAVGARVPLGLSVSGFELIPSDPTEQLLAVRFPAGLLRYESFYFGYMYYLGPWPVCSGNSASYILSKVCTSLSNVPLEMLARMALKKLSTTWWLWICSNVHASISLALSKCLIYARWCFWHV